MQVFLFETNMQFYVSRILRNNFFGQTFLHKFRANQACSSFFFLNKIICIQFSVSSSLTCLKFNLREVTAYINLNQDSNICFCGLCIKESASEFCIQNFKTEFGLFLDLIRHICPLGPLSGLILKASVNSLRR